MTILVPRFTLGLVLMVLLYLILKVLLCGYKANTPMGTCRRRALRWSYKFFCYIFMVLVEFTFVTWRYVDPKEVNHYSEYLGSKEDSEELE